MTFFPLTETMLWCCVQVYLQRLPGFAGRRYGDLQAYLPYATVYDILPMPAMQCLE